MVISSFGALQIPALLVAPVRALFNSRGIEGASAVAADGTVDSQALLAIGFNTLTIRSRVAPDIVINLRDLTPSPSSSGLLRYIQPEIVFDGPAGRIPIAPWGAPTGIASEISKIGTTTGFAIGAGLLGLVLVGAAILR